MSHKNKQKNKYNANNKMDNDNVKPQSPEDSNMEESKDEELSADVVEPEETATQMDSEEVCEDAEKKIAELQQQLEKEKKEYLFLLAEFDNFRRRSLREKSEIIKNAGENVLKGLLPIMDDFERGIKAAENNPEADSVKEGVNLIYNKLKTYLSQNGVKEMNPDDDTFDTEKHEAISVVPVPEEEKKGKILSTVEKGYTINDKVLRHAKVVVGQ